MLMWKLNTLVGRCKDRGVVVQYRDMSQSTGISTSTLTEIMHGRQKRIDLSTVDRLLTYFSEKLNEDLTIGDLLEWQRDATPRASSN